MKTLLWLDDMRDPHAELPGEGSWLVFSPIEKPYEVVWVQSYVGFVDWITKNGLPDGICFDHDLGDNPKLRAGLEFYKWYNMDDEREYTGYDAAKWLIYYCMQNSKQIPPYNIQSANPVGAENIRLALEGAKRHLSGG